MTRVSACILGCAGPTLSRDEAAFFAEAQPWGFILFARNIEGPDQLRALTADLRAAVDRPAPILIDQEGGRVQRMWAPHWREWRPALDQMAAAGPAGAARSMRLRYRLIAHELRDVGIDVNCAPLGDLIQSDTHPVLQNRGYGGDPVTVVGAARAVAEGLLAGGVLPVMKHIPGHGRANVDSHHDLPVVTESRAVLDAGDFATFRGLADLPMGMTAHVIYEAVDPIHPGTTSSQVIALIRDHIGFEGLLMTDDVSMNALSGTVAERAAAARAAGCDLILHCNGNRTEMEAVLPEVGPLTPKAMERAARALDLRAKVDPLDIDAAEAELADLIDGGAYA